MNQHEARWLARLIGDLEDGRASFQKMDPGNGDGFTVPYGADLSDVRAARLRGDERLSQALGEGRGERLMEQVERPDVERHRDPLLLARSYLKLKPRPRNLPVLVVIPPSRPA